MKFAEGLFLVIGFKNIAQKNVVIGREIKELQFALYLKNLKELQNKNLA